MFRGYNLFTSSVYEQCDRNGLFLKDFSRTISNKRCPNRRQSFTWIVQKSGETKSLSQPLKQCEQMSKSGPNLTQSYQNGCHISFTFKMQFF